jgi:hypothetical protein
MPFIVLMAGVLLAAAPAVAQSKTDPFAPPRLPALGNQPEAGTYDDRSDDISVALVARAADVSGAWALQFQRDGGDALYEAKCSFKQEADRLTGSCLSGFESIVPVRGSVQGAHVTFQFTTGIDSGTSATFSGQLDAQETSLEGTWRFVDEEGNEGQGSFTATKD